MASAVIAVFVHVPIANFDSKCHSEVIACCRNDRQSVKKSACLGAVDELAARIVAMRIVSGHRFWIALASGLSEGGAGRGVMRPQAKLAVHNIICAMPGAP